MKTKGTMGILAVLLVALLVGACTPVAATDMEMPVGMRFTVTLDSVASCCAAWRVSYSESLLHWLDSEVRDITVFPDGTCRETFTFEAKSTGLGWVRLICRDATTGEIVNKVVFRVRIR